MQNFGLKDVDLVATFGDTNSILITDRNGDESYIVDKFPEFHYSEFGLLTVGEDIHLLEEDDGFYWTSLIFTQEGFSEFVESMKYLKSNIQEKKSKKGYWLSKLSFIDKIPKIKSKHFNIHYTFKGKNINHCEIKIGKQKLLMSSFGLTCIFEILNKIK